VPVTSTVLFLRNEQAFGGTVARSSAPESVGTTSTATGPI
jgi:hypothetical protein